MPEILRFVLRLSPSLHEALKRLAEEDRRSLHSEIIYVLEQFVRSREAQRGDD